MAKSNYLVGKCSIGVVDMVPVVLETTQLGWLGHEPFLTVADGKIQNLDDFYAIRAPVFAKVPEKIDP